MTLPLRFAADLFLIATACSAPASLAGEAEGGQPIGVVTRVQNEASVRSGAQVIRAITGTPVHLQAELQTGADARLEVTFNDQTMLTLGEHASMSIDAYVYDPEKGAGEALLQTTQGAFRFVTGKIKQLKDKNIAVITPVAEIGVRGTEFWGGPIEAEYGVLLLEGEVAVSTKEGTVLLSKPGEGTRIAPQLGPPTSPSAWDAAMIARAVATVSFR